VGCASSWILRIGGGVSYTVAVFGISDANVLC
jgi:hypothetical protein